MFLGCIVCRIAKIENSAILSLTLRLRPKKVVNWGEDVVDNELLGRRKSKKCCIFHKQRKFGESSSESEGYSSEGGLSSSGESVPTNPRRSCAQCKAVGTLAATSNVEEHCGGALIAPHGGDAPPSDGGLRGRRTWSRRMQDGGGAEGGEEEMANMFRTAGGAGDR